MSQWHAFFQTSKCSARCLICIFKKPINIHLHNKTWPSERAITANCPLCQLIPSIPSQKGSAESPLEILLPITTIPFLPRPSSPHHRGSFPPGQPSPTLITSSASAFLLWGTQRGCNMSQGKNVLNLRVLRAFTVTVLICTYHAWRSRRFFFFSCFGFKIWIS